MDSWLLKLLSRDMKIKTKKKISQQTIRKNRKPKKNNRKLKKQQTNKSNGKYNIYHGLSQKWINGRY